MDVPENSPLREPCAGADAPVVTIDPATGRPTTSDGQALAFGARADGATRECELKRAGWEAVVSTFNAGQARLSEALRERTWLERLTPWRE